MGDEPDLMLANLPVKGVYLAFHAVWYWFFLKLDQTSAHEEVKHSRISLKIWVGNEVCH